ncbi:MAG TPA: sulfatase-like hydrolase/transferase [Polyangiaceae bacterium]|nr:sulfatase-like hydrolase/transferase [Polyangiaceae bacterium]
MDRASVLKGRRKRRLLQPLLGALWLPLLSGWACSNRGSKRPAPTAVTSAPPAPVASEPLPVVVDGRDRFEIIPNLSWCEVDHQGLLIDLGSPAAAAYTGFGAERSDDYQDIERDGQSFVRAFGRSLKYDFWLDEARAGTSISVRVHGGDAKWLGLTIDDKRVGSVRPSVAETKVYSLPPLAAELARGHHRLKLSFSGAPRGTRGMQGEIDWVRIGERGDDTAGYAAPTLSSIVGDVVLNGAPKRALVLNPPSTLRCWLRPAADARLKVALGFWGAGKGTAEVRVVADGEEPVVLQTRRVAGGDSASWTPLAVDLAPFAGKVIGVEFRALDGSRGGRVAFGDPSIARRAASPIAIPKAKVAILLLEAGIDRRRVPPFGPTGKLPALGELGRAATAFSGYRAPSVVVQSVAASLLTGLSPRTHRVEDGSSRVADSVRLLSEMVKEASGRAALFTGVPNTFAAFGFGSGWDTFDALSPVLDLPATEPLSRALKWLETELDDAHPGPRLLVVHARGSHPPWDLTREETQTLKPDEYAGVLDPRRGGIMLAALRARRRVAHHLQDEDWVRLHALQDAALSKQDQLIGQLVALLKKKGAWERTMIVFAGDVSAGEPPDSPYDPHGTLAEDRLAVPLVVKFPGGDLDGRDERLPASAADVSATLLTALGIPVPESVEGVDLYAAAHGMVPVVTKALVASAPGRYSTRLGSWLLRGEFGKKPMLCAIDLDPACVNDVFDEKPYAARALWLSTFRAESAALHANGRPKEKQPAVLDPDTVAALTVWGDIR